MSKKTPEVAKADGSSDFDMALDGFRNSAVSMQSFGRICAETGLRHFYAHGDTILCQRFLDVMEEKSLKNSTRPAAFKNWLRAFAPITMKEGKLVKDQKRAEEMFANKDELIAKACETPYWDHTPDTQQVAWTETDIVKKLNSVVKSFEKEDGPKAANVSAIAFLGEVKKAVNDLETKATVHKLQHGAAVAAA